MLSATVVGNLGSDAEIRDAAGTPVLNFSVASSTKVKGEDQTTWVRCAMFGARAEAVAEYLVKGKQVAVCGSLTLRQYETDAGKGSSLEMRVDNIQLLGGSKSEEAAPTNGSRKPTPTKSSKPVAKSSRR